MFEIPQPKVIEPDVFVFFSCGVVNLRDTKTINWYREEDKSILKILYKDGTDFCVAMKHEHLDDFIYNLKTTMTEHNMGYDFANDPQISTVINEEELENE